MNEYRCKVCGGDKILIACPHCRQSSVKTSSDIDSIIFRCAICSEKMLVIAPNPIEESEGYDALVCAECGSSSQEVVIDTFQERLFVVCVGCRANKIIMNNLRFEGEDEMPCNDGLGEAIGKA